MAGRRNRLSEPMLTRFTDAYICDTRGRRVKETSLLIQGTILGVGSANESQRYIVNVISHWPSPHPEWSLLIPSYHAVNNNDMYAIIYGYNENKRLSIWSSICRYDNLRCHQWCQKCQPDDLLFSVKVGHYNGVIMMVADVLVPIWHQDICNHHDNVAYLIHIMKTSM